MKVTKIAFKGYQRLVDTACNTDGKLIAFLGPNEAGKTTVLRALDWYSHGGGALPAPCRNKLSPPAASDAVVEVTYWLEPEDMQSLNDIEFVGTPQTYTRGRRPDGTFQSTISPGVRRNPAPIELARAEFAKVLTAEEDPGDGDGDDVPRVARFAEVVQAALDDSNGPWHDDWDESYLAAVEALRDSGADNVAAALEDARAALNAENPDSTIRSRLRNRAPRFVTFTEADRDLKSSYELSDPDVRDNPTPALANLTWVAGLDLADLWESIETDQRRNARTTERRANERLEERLGPRWSQKQIDVEFNVSGTSLEIQVHEHAEDGADTPVEERSDGLRTFIALVAFLARQDFDTPPVLLVDEAETHLHYDAQADLVEVLTKDVEASQVFYSTHSPGCLPRDLGTGIRLVEPINGRSDASRLSNDFWTSSSPGFTPLLFAMGAGAAAFSAFRRAVLTEGAADMILLPSLLRVATGRKDLDFQVAPGISNYHGSGLELEEVAARVVYLVDGDTGGDAHRDRLVEMGIPEERIKQFPAPKATEDFVHPERYLRLINELLGLSVAGQQIEPGDLDQTVSVSKAVELWCAARDLKPPGKTIVASQLANEPASLVLADGAKAQLTAIHVDLMRALNAKPGRR
jgi:hypothetical protein